MRLRLLTALGVTALALAAPGAALAGHGHHHHHKAKAKGHHASVRFVHFGAATTTPESGPNTGSGAATDPKASTTPPSTPENAGTVASYTNGVLTLTLGDGSTVSGKVTNHTEIQCLKAAPAPPAGTEGQPTDQSPGDDNGQGDDQSRGDMSQQGDHESSGSDESQQGDGRDNGDDDGESQGATEPPCDTSALVTGAVVRAAELRIGPAGSEFESVELVR